MDEENKKVRAKFRCMEMRKSTGGSSKEHPFAWTYHFNAVAEGSEENKQFWHWTPSGSIDLTALRDDLFEVGQTYYLDFTPAPA
jgi:hypothetical protein